MIRTIRSRRNRKKTNISLRILKGISLKQRRNQKRESCKHPETKMVNGSKKMTSMDMTAEDQAICVNRSKKTMTKYLAMLNLQDIIIIKARRHLVQEIPWSSKMKDSKPSNPKGRSLEIRLHSNTILRLPTSNKL